MDSEYLRQDQAEANVVLSVEIEGHKPLMGYRGDENMAFLKITLTDPKSVPKVRDTFFCSSSGLAYLDD